MEKNRILRITQGDGMPLPKILSTYVAINNATQYMHDKHNYVKRLKASNQKTHGTL